MPEASTKASVIDVLVCDDIRTEDNGKPMLIGVYSGDILVPDFPANLVLALFIGIRLPVGETAIEVKLSVGNRVGPEIEFTVEGPVGGTFYLPTPKMPLSFNESEPLNVFCRFNKRGRWLEVLKKRIITREAFEKEAKQLRASGAG
jgi:hypothetical protein